MSQKKWDATIVFMAVAGEEQGLFGSTHWARMAKEKNWNIAGMITNDIIGSSHADPFSSLAGAAAALRSGSRSRRDRGSDAVGWPYPGFCSSASFP